MTNLSDAVAVALTQEASAEFHADMNARKEEARTRYGYVEIDEELLCVPVKLEVSYDYAPAERTTDYAGYLDVISVKLNGAEIPVFGELEQQIKRCIRQQWEDQRG